MVEGEVEVSIRTPRIERAVWRKGDVLCLLPSMARRNQIISGKTIHHCGLALSLGAMQVFDPFSFYDMPIVISGANAERLAMVLKEFLATKDVVNPIERAVIRKGLCFRLLSELFASAVPKPDMERRFLLMGRLNPAVLSLLEKFSSRPDIHLLAKRCSLSQSRFHALFKQTFGCPPHEFVKRKRLEVAAGLLSCSDLQIGEVGQKAGWPDPFNFSRVFKSFFGVSPRRYRANIKAGKQVI